MVLINFFCHRFHRFSQIFTDLACFLMWLNVLKIKNPVNVDANRVLLKNMFLSFYSLMNLLLETPLSVFIFTKYVPESNAETSMVLVFSALATTKIS